MRPRLNKAADGSYRVLFAATLSIGALVVTGCERKPVLLSVHGKSVSDWVTATKDRDPHVRKRAVSALQSVGGAEPTAIPAIAAALQDQDPSVRDAAALAILNIGVEASVSADALRNAQSDKNSSVRAHATAALARLQAYP